MNGPTPNKVDDTKKAVAIIVLTVLALSFGDALIKKFSVNLVLWQIFVLRSLLATAALLLVMRLRFASVHLLPDAVLWTFARSAMLTAMWTAYYASLPHVALSIAAATFYTLPIFITLFSGLFIGERVTKLGWLAIGLGFSGVSLILKPTASDFNLYALLPLISAILYALAMILTRTKCRDEHPLVLSLALNLTFIVAGLVATLLLPILPIEFAGNDFLSPAWARMSTSELIAIAVLTMAILVGSIGTAVAYQIGKPSTVATSDFAYVACAVIWGLVFFSEIPDPVAAAGILLIVLAGIIAIRR